MNNKRPHIKRYPDATPSPIIEAHNERVAAEKQINKNVIIQQLSRQLEKSRSESEALSALTKVQLAQIRELKKSIKDYQSLKWRVRAWLILKELFAR